jgi:hypothetical protein
VQPSLVLSVLAVLPPSARTLELGASCAGPVLEALQRFSRLQELRITGSGAGIAWDSRRAPAVLPKPAQLRLDYRQPFEWEGLQDSMYNPQNALVSALPAGMIGMLAPATRLHTLALCLKWSDGVPALCSALSTLLELR